MLSSTQFHKDFSAYKVSTHEIGVNGLELSNTVSDAALSALLAEPNNEPFSFKARSTSSIKFRLERESDRCFMVTTTGALDLESTCVRCLSPMNLQLSLNFKIRMLDKKSLGAKDSETTDFQFSNFEIDMSSDEDPQVGYFSNQCIDLGIILRDQIFLMVPDYPQCGGNISSSGKKSCEKEITKMIRDEDTIAHNNPFVKLLGKVAPANTIFGD